MEAIIQAILLHLLVLKAVRFGEGKVRRLGGTVVSK